MQIRFGHVVLALLALGLLALWYFGRTYPIEVQARSREQAQVVMCRMCGGGGARTCSACGGFGTVAAMGTCPLCGGTGKHEWRFGNKPDAPCQQCRGSGKVEERTPCTTCGGKGRQRCVTCGGTGWSRITATANAQVVVMKPSLWERVLRFVGFPVEPNPCPQRAASGAYPLVEAYVNIRGARQPVHVKRWGVFKISGGEWTMAADVVFSGADGSTRTREIEFVVKDRALVRSRTLN